MEVRGNREILVEVGGVIFSKKVDGLGVLLLK